MASEDQLSPEAKKQAAVKQLRSLVGAGLNQEGWSKAWENGVTPWDAGQPQPTLLNFIQKTDARRRLLADAASRQGGVIVPGCGSGWDLSFFADLGYAPAVGVDIAPEATKAAQRWFDSLEPRPKYYDAVSFQTADFFEDTDGSLSGFALAYDYTFFCAIPPALRPKWAQAYARSVKTEGHLITLVFPIDGDRQDGPPYSVSPELIASHLAPYFDLVWQGVPPEQPEARKGKEEVLLWKRKA